ncbi:MAG: hypothetical protein HC819_03220 [Cyclobacteriaceae bacterium]|nr:hypothetical protein [Cyclobacteriaceae bacterium]
MKFKNYHLIICILGIGFLMALTSSETIAQCNSKIEAKAKSISEEEGEIIVEITSSQGFICRLNTVSGKGIVQVDSQNGNGNKTIKFSSLDKYKMYQVEVEFLSEENKLCQKLQKNDLIFESN